MTDVTVLGLGQVGRAVVDRLSAAGFSCRAGDRNDGEALARAGGRTLILALMTGAQSVEALGWLAPGAFRSVLDLTTQSPATVADAGRAAAAAGVAYAGGGLSGGAAHVRSGTATLLLGPAPLPDDVREVASAIGTARCYPTAAVAATAKLLHNFVLVVHQWAIAAALGEARRHGIDDLADVLATGTAGRPAAETSLVRDLAAATPGSSYAGRLMAKDVAEIRASFLALATVAGPVLDDVVDAVSRHPDEPFTSGLRELVNRR